MIIKPKEIKSVILKTLIIGMSNFLKYLEPNEMLFIWFTGINSYRIIN